MNKLCPLGPAGVGRIVNLFFGPAWVPSCNYTKGALIYHMNVVCAVLQRYLALKGEVKEAEQIRKSVYNILRQEQREQ